MKGYLATAAIVAFIVVALAAGLIAKINQPPPEKRAFKSEWACRTYGYGGEVCEKRPR